MIGKSNIGGENLNAQLTAQETLIQTITESLVGKATLANATADKIIEGFCAYVGQQLIQGTAKDPSQFADLKGLLGFTKMAIDKFTPASRGYASSSKAYELSHSLGECPKIALLLSDVSRSGADNDVAFLMCRAEYDIYTFFGYFRSGALTYGNASSAALYPSGNSSTGSQKITLNASGAVYYFTAGTEYTLITLA